MRLLDRNHPTYGIVIVLDQGIPNNARILKVTNFNIKEGECPEVGPRIKNGTIKQKASTSCEKQYIDPIPYFSMRYGRTIEYPIATAASKLKPKLPKRTPSS